VSNRKSRAVRKRWRHTNCAVAFSVVRGTVACAKDSKIVQKRPRDTNASFDTRFRSLVWTQTFRSVYETINPKFLKTISVDRAEKWISRATQTQIQIYGKENKNSYLFSARLARASVSSVNIANARRNTDATAWSVNSMPSWKTAPSFLVCLAVLFALRCFYYRRLARLNQSLPTAFFRFPWKFIIIRTLCINFATF